MRAHWVMVGLLAVGADASLAAADGVPAAEVTAEDDGFAGQRKLFRSGIVVVGLGLQAGAAYAKDIFCCAGPKSNRTLGARVILELGRARGWRFVAEAGADGYTSHNYATFVGDDTIFDAYATFVPAFSLRAAYSWAP